MTFAELYRQGAGRLSEAGVPDAANDALILICRAAGMDTSVYLMRRGETAGEAVAAEYGRLIEKRAERIPLQQLLGEAWFMGYPFMVNGNVLIPRQDTETLVETVLEENTDAEASVLDLCTGSGCIAIALKLLGHYKNVLGTDISAEALKVAEANAKRLEAGSGISFAEADLFCGGCFGGSCGERGADKFDIITANPPYIRTAVIEELEPEVRLFEPRTALDGSEDGLVFYRRIASESPEWLKNGGRLYLEIGYDQAEDVSGLLSARGFSDVRVIKDLCGNDRVVKAVWYGSI